MNDVLRWAQNVAFLAVGVWALAAWWDRRDARSGWLGVTFGVLSAVVLLGFVTDQLEDSALTGALGRVTIAVLASFPYLLLRFLDSFEPLSSRLRRAALGTTLALAAWAVLLPEIPEAGEPRGLGFAAFVLVFVVYWFAALALVGRRFWVAGHGQPTLARRRLRLLAVASVILGLVLLLSGSAGGDASAVLILVTRLMGLASAILFLLGLAPPRVLRIAWRQPEQQQLHAASLRLMTAVDPEEVGEILAPHLMALVGARAVSIVHHGEIVGYRGIELPQAWSAAQNPADDGVVEMPLTDGRILVWTDRYTPFFGEEEIALLHRLGLLADLALDRTSLLHSERDARLELERANQELEAFVYTASHDLKSPLIAMLGYLEVLEVEHGAQLGEQGEWYIERMLTNGRYMEALIGDLLELSRVGRVQAEPEHIELHELAERLFDQIGGRYPAVNYRIEGRLPALWINPTRARQLLGNLLENAGKYGGQDLTVTVACRALDDGGVEIAVRDDGVGIPAAYAETIFAVFERLEPDDSQSGTGIGLAICRKIVEALGGTIRLAETDHGADFRIHLPSDVVRERAAPDRAEEVPA